MRFLRCTGNRSIAAAAAAANTIKSKRKHTATGRRQISAVDVLLLYTTAYILCSTAVVCLYSVFVRQSLLISNTDLQRQKYMRSNVSLQRITYDSSKSVII